jgi:hypothetical protein
MTLIGLILSAVLFFGSLILLYQVVTLNPVSSFSVSVIILSTFFGLGLGTIIGWFITFDLLKNLRQKTEYKQIQSKIFMFTFVVGLPLFVLVSLIVIRTLRVAFMVGEIIFVFSAVFTFFSTRMALITRFEHQTRKIIMMDYFNLSGRIFIKSS